MAFSGMINVKTGQLTLGGQFDAYKRGQLGRNIHQIYYSFYISLTGNLVCSGFSSVEKW